MQLAQTASVDYESGSPPPRSRGTKALVAGVTVATAGALAVAPVLVAPEPPEVRVASTAVGLSAFQNPLELWGETFENVWGTVAAGRWVKEREKIGEDEDGEDVFEWVDVWQAPLIENISTAAGNLANRLGDSGFQAEFAGMFSNLDPEQMLGAVLGFQDKYGDRFDVAGDGGTDVLQNAIHRLFNDTPVVDENGDPVIDEETGEQQVLPAVLPRTLELLADGQFFMAFSEINFWLLVDGLSDGRQSQLDVLRVPGDFLEDLGLDPLARILGTSWMGTNDGLLSRGVLGNFARGLLAPQVTTIFQTMEILDAVYDGVQNGDFVKVASELINAPAKISNAFLNGYLPGPLEDFTVGAGRGQAFPGILSPTGPFDFVFNQLPSETAKTLGMTKPEDQGEGEDADISTADQGDEAAAKAATDARIGRNFVPVQVVDQRDTATDVPPAEEPEDPAPSDTEEVTAEDDDLKPAAVDSALTPRDRLQQARGQATEARQERVENLRATGERVRSTVRGATARNGSGLSADGKGTEQGQGAGSSSTVSDGSGSDGSGSTASANASTDDRSESSRVDRKQRDGKSRAGNNSGGGTNSGGGEK